MKQPARINQINHNHGNSGNKKRNRQRRKNSKHPENLEIINHATLGNSIIVQPNVKF